MFRVPETGFSEARGHHVDVDVDVSVYVHVYVSVYVHVYVYVCACPVIIANTSRLYAPS